MSAARSAATGRRTARSPAGRSAVRPQARARAPPAAGTACRPAPRPAAARGGRRATGCTTMRVVAEGGPAEHASRARRAAGRRCASCVASVACVPAASRGVEVADDVGAAEGVDRLLRVADQDERRVAVEGGAQDVPLHRVGVLELVDEHHPVARPQPLAGGRARPRVGERGVQPGEHVVVGEEAPRAACAAPPRRARPRGEPVRASRPAPAGSPSAGASARPGRRPRPGPARARCRGRTAGRRPSAAAVLADVEVVDDLGDQVVDLLDEPRVGVGVAGDAEAREHLLAELVGGGDRGRVEVGERVGQPRAPAGPLGVVDRRGPAPSPVVAARVAGSASARSTATSRSRTRSRSSRVASRPNVTSMSSAASRGPRRRSGRRARRS